eukprot:462852-Amphidinium_carterae.2
MQQYCNSNSIAILNVPDAAQMRAQACVCVCIPLPPIPTDISLATDNVATGENASFETMPVDVLSFFLFQKYLIKGNKRFVFLEHGCSGLPISQSFGFGSLCVVQMGKSAQNFPKRGNNDLRLLEVAL